MYTSEYPPIGICADIALWCNHHILLIKRGGEPYKDHWALPGGFVDQDERISDAALRELKEETSIEIAHLSFVKFYDAPSRDPRGRTVSFLYRAELNKRPNVLVQDDAVGFMWADILKLPENLAFDHRDMIATTYMLRSKYAYG